MATIVSIGRNIGHPPIPMSDLQWGTFARKVQRLLEEETGETFFVGFGRGVHDGEFEESWTGVFGDIPIGDGAETYLRIRRGLADLAVAYGQESIALTEGYTAFIGGVPKGSITSEYV